MNSYHQQLEQMVEDLYNYAYSMGEQGLTTAPSDSPVTIATTLQAIDTLIREEIIGEDEIRVSVGIPSFPPDPATAVYLNKVTGRNQLRAEQRQLLEDTKGDTQ